MVVPDPGLVTGHRTARLDASHQTHGSERIQRVVHRLVGHVGQLDSHDAQDRVRVSVGVPVHCRKNRKTGTRDAQGGAT